MPEFTYKDNEKVALTIAKKFLHTTKILSKDKGMYNSCGVVCTVPYLAVDAVSRVGDPIRRLIKQINPNCKLLVDGDRCTDKIIGESAQAATITFRDTFYDKENDYYSDDDLGEEYCGTEIYVSAAETPACPTVVSITVVLEGPC